MERKHACDQCQYSTNKPSNLKQHKESKHEEVRYPCHILRGTLSLGNLLLLLVKSSLHLLLLFVLGVPWWSSWLRSVMILQHPLMLRMMQTLEPLRTLSKHNCIIYCLMKSANLQNDIFFFK